MTPTIAPPPWHVTDESPMLVFSSLSHFGILGVTGEQGRSFIHGQVTADITSLEKEQWTWSAHCDPKGKMLATFRIFNLNNNLALMMPRDTLKAALPQLNKYAVFNNVQLNDISDKWLILGIAGSEATTWVNQHFGEMEQAALPIPSGVLLKDGARFILIINQTAAKPLLSKIDQPIYHHQVWQRLEIEAGYPNLSASHQHLFVPQMCNLQAIGGICFNKGCYMGQETIARMKYRGGIKRALFILTGQATTTIDHDSQLELMLDDNFKKTGTIIEFVQSDQRVLLTAVLPNDIDPNATLRLAGDPTSSLKIQPLPYSLEDPLE